MLLLNNGKRCFPCAFTLVELMVVIAVMAVLVMILIPSFQTARARARSTICQNNLRQYGIAMGRYMSDWKGYFIYPGEGGSYAMYKAKGKGPDAFDMTSYEAGIDAAAGGVGGAEYQSWASFIVGYLPKIMDINDVRMIDTVKSVRICPEVQMELKNGNYFDTKSSNFKGFATNMINGELCDVADFEEVSGNGYDADDNLILENYFSTYAINNYPGVYRGDRKNISANTIAFIDWNAKEGWGASLYHNPNAWQFTSPSGANPYRTQGADKWTTNWCLTEVGFHHKDGTNAYANYVAMDGHVGWVTSNQINHTYFQPAGPR